MTCKFTLTTACGARCATCPGWERPIRHGIVVDLILAWGKIVSDPMIDKVIVNNTGDLYTHPEHERLLRFMERNKNGRYIAMTTNGALLDYVPRFDDFILSWNGSTPETYEKTTGLSWERVRARVREAIPALKDLYPHDKIEMHCLLYDETDGDEAEARLLDAWADWPGRIRVSRKYDNQGLADHTVGKFKREDRIPCDYLTQLCVEQDGVVSMCAHDWHRTEAWGSIHESAAAVLMRDPRRLTKWHQHNRGEWTGVCGPCNYNVPVADQVRYIR